jgi:hypothetical protein
MLEDGSGEIRIVEGEMVRFDEGEDIGPVLVNVVTGGLADRMKFEGDHRDEVEMRKGLTDCQGAGAGGGADWSGRTCRFTPKKILGSKVWKATLTGSRISGITF